MIPFLKKNKDGKKPPKPTVPRTAQESIPFQRMFEDGICRVRPGYYTRTIQYQDINYQLAQQEDKTAIFEEWCSFLNFFDSSIHFELSFVNTATDSADFEKSIRIPYQQDGFDDVRAEYSQMLRQQLSKGNNGLTKTKFLTYGIEGESMAQVKPRLEHIQNDLMNNFHQLGVLAKPLDGTERLRLMHGMLNMDGANKFHFNWKDLVPSGLSVKDAIAPTALAFKNSRTFQMGGIFGAVSFLNITASDLSDQLLKDFLDMDSSQIVTMHIQSVDQNKAIKTIKHTITELDRSKIEEQKKAVRAGYDMDVLPSDLATYGRDAKALLKELQSQNERMFLVTFLVLNTGKTEQELETNVFQAVSIAQKHNCELCRLDFQQEQGLMSSLPLADCQIEIQRGLTTSSTAIFVPFTTQELFDNGKESLYYGLNALSNNLIMVDRKKLKNPNGLTKTKFLTYGIEGDSMAQVKPRLEHIQNDLMNNFHRLGVLAKPLDGTERLRLMHGMLNMDGANKFHFNWKDLVPSGLSVKDVIASTALAFKNSRTFQMGGIFGAVSFLNITASDLSDQLLKDFLDMDSSQIVTMHIQSVDQNKAIKTIKHTITELDRSKIEEQKKAVRAGYDMDVLPSDLATYGRDAKALLKELQSQNERMFLVTFLVLNTGKTEQELETNVFQAVSIAQKHNCELCRLDFQQEQGLMSSLPLADCQIEIQRGLTTSSTAIFVPFTTQELFDNGKEALYYGLNALSNNLIMVDRKKLKNPNGLILGTPGSGKSFSAKREICNAFLVTDDDILVCDPESEYAPLVERLHGQVIHISPSSTQYINPMDINANYSEEDNPLALKADFILSLCELVVGGKEGLKPVEKTVIDRCVHKIYAPYFEHPCPETVPMLEDLYNALLTQDEPEAHHVAAALEIYVKGSLNIFNHRTNVDLSKTKNTLKELMIRTSS